MDTKLLERIQDLAGLLLESNRFIYDGKKYWSGIVDLRDGQIEEVHTYEEAQNSDFHHSFYITPTNQDKMKEGVVSFFYVNKNKVILNGSGQKLNPKIESRIKEQIKINE